MNDYGGINTLKAGLNALDKPKVNSMLKGFGVDVGNLKTLGNSLLDNQQTKTNTPNNVSNMQSRLQRLKK